MALNENLLSEIDVAMSEWCLERVPPQYKHKLDHDYEIDGKVITIFEVRPDDAGRPLRRSCAQVKYKAKYEWRLYRKMKSGAWQTYEPLPCTPSLGAALGYIGIDPDGLFFG